MKKIAIIKFPGSNCEDDVFKALKKTVIFLLWNLVFQKEIY